MIVYTYQKPIRNKILNYQETVIKSKFEDIEKIECKCQQHKDTIFYNHDHKHVITGDASFVNNTRLQLLLEKGPQYRDNIGINWQETETEIIMA